MFGCIVFNLLCQGKNFVYQLLKKVGKGERMAVPADQWATQSYGPDVARATLELVEQGARGVWNVCGPDLMDRAEFARERVVCFCAGSRMLRCKAVTRRSACCS